jgi:tRNA A37 threonylcarbamoyladenosine synthetase subunit TsaC/SUA5/YrdC
LSQDAQSLYEIKSRPSSKPFIKVYKDFKTFKKEGKRVVNNRKNLVRRSKKTTFIIDDFSFRVAPFALNSEIFRDNSWFYSTSANRSGEKFGRDFCESKADIIVENTDGLAEREPSRLMKINRAKRRRLR